MLGVGCTPGTIRWESGEDTLRSALFIPGAVSTQSGAPSTNHLVLLTTAELTCDDLTAFGDDTTEARDQLLRMVSGICRDDAQVLVLDLVHTPDATVPGHYAVIDHPRTADEPVDWPATLADTPRVAWGRYLAIDEVAMDLDLGLDRPSLRITAATSHDRLDPRGDVRVRTADADRLAGTFSFPAQHVSGDFRADPCEGDATFFTLVEQLRVQPPADCPIALSR